MKFKSELSLRLSEAGTILEASRGLDHLLRVAPGDLLGRPLSELLTLEQSERVLEELRRLRAGEPGGFFPLDLLEASGGRAQADWCFCWDGEERVFLGRVPDRSVGIPDSADTLRLLLDHLEEGVIAVNSSWDYQLVNRAAAQIVGLELLNLPITEWPSQYGAFSGPHGPRLPLEHWPISRGLAGEPVQSDDVYYRTPSREGWLHCRACPVVDGALVVFRDITAQRETLRNLGEQAALLDEAKDAIIVRDLRGQVTYWSRGAERIYGWSSEEAKRGPYEQLDRQAWSEVHEHGAWSGELSRVSADGKSVLVEARWTLMHDPDGKPRGILSIETDITEKRQLEAQFLRAQRLESLGTMAGGIAHDLNNVLAPILMAVDLLGAQSLDEEGRELLSLVSTSARRGAELVKQVLTFARGVEGKPVAIHVGLLVDEVARMARDTFPKSLRVEVEVAPGLPSVQADPTQIHQVLLNLCLNSRDSMPRGGVLTLRAMPVELTENEAAHHPGARPGTYVVLSVTDTGEGMEPEIRERIFEPFFTTKPHGKGTGLGLSTALAIVKSHGGFITVSSDPQRGSTFRVHLRATALAPAEGARLESAPRGRGELVLVVDDEAPVRHLTQQSLENHGYRVLSASDGAEAVAVFAQHRQEVELVLLDMLMPVMDGYTTICVLQRIEPAPTVVAAIGLATPAEVARVQELGVRHVLAKPYAPDLLLRTVREALDQSPSRITSAG